MSLKSKNHLKPSNEKYLIISLTAAGLFCGVVVCREINTDVGIITIHVSEPRLISQLVKLFPCPNHTVTCYTHVVRHNTVPVHNATVYIILRRSVRQLYLRRRPRFAIVVPVLLLFNRDDRQTSMIMINDISLKNIIGLNFLLHIIRFICN